MGQRFCRYSTSTTSSMPPLLPHLASTDPTPSLYCYCFVTLLLPPSIPQVPKTQICRPSGCSPKLFYRLLCQLLCWLLLQLFSQLLCYCYSIGCFSATIVLRHLVRVSTSFYAFVVNPISACPSATPFLCFHDTPASISVSLSPCPAEHSDTPIILQRWRVRRGRSMVLTQPHPWAYIDTPTSCA